MAVINVLSGASADERDKRVRLSEALRQSPLPDNELLNNLGLYLNRQSLSRILYMHELYKMIVPVHGVVMEFGVRWGQNLSLFTSFRGIYEPYNYNRKLIGFDTFSGFPSVDNKDGDLVKVGDYGVSTGYQEQLTDLLRYQESENPIPHKQKFELVAGDASLSIHEYLAKHPETIVALAYFDFDIYQPTLDCLKAILPRLTKGSVLAFDELNCPEFPGETLALMETIGLTHYAIRRSPLNPLCSYLVID